MIKDKLRFAHASIVATIVLFLLTTSSGARADLIPLSVSAEAFARDSQDEEGNSSTDDDGDNYESASVPSVSASARGYGMVDPPSKFESASEHVSYHFSDPDQQGYASASTGGTDLVILGDPGGIATVKIVIPSTVEPGWIPPDVNGPVDPAAWNNYLFSDPSPTDELLKVSIAASITVVVGASPNPVFDGSGTVDFWYDNLFQTGFFADPTVFQKLDPGTAFVAGDKELGSFDVTIPESGAASVTLDSSFFMGVGDPNVSPPDGWDVPAGGAHGGGDFGLFVAALADPDDFEFAAPPDVIVPEASSLICWTTLLIMGLVACRFRRSRAIRRTLY